MARSPKSSENPSPPISRPCVSLRTGLYSNICPACSNLLGSFGAGGAWVFDYVFYDILNKEWKRSQMRKKAKVTSMIVCFSQKATSQ